MERASRSSELAYRDLQGKFVLPVVDSDAVRCGLREWMVVNKNWIQDSSDCYGAVLFHGFNIRSVADFNGVATAICGHLMRHNGEHVPAERGSAVQRPVAYPPESKLLWHNENSFNDSWPTKIIFGCTKSADEGGHTLLVDARKVCSQLDESIRKSFTERGVMYVRTYGDAVGVHWRYVFGTDKREDVERKCTELGFTYDWDPTDPNILVTRCVRPAVLKHFRTGEESWFCQPQHWHLACLAPETRRLLEATFPADRLPRNCHYGDGTPISDSTMESLSGVYRGLEAKLLLEEGDILLIDNVLVAHGRDPYVGRRDILVALGDCLAY